MGTIWSKKKNANKGGASGSKGSASTSNTAAASASSSSKPLSSSSTSTTGAKPKSPSPRQSMEKRSLDRSESSSSHSVAKAKSAEDNSASKASSSTAAAAVAAEPVKPRLAESDIRRVLVDLWDVTRSTFGLVGEICTAEFGTDEFWANVEAKFKACDSPYQTLRDEAKMRSWVTPLPPSQTGTVLVAANGLVRAYDAVGQKVQHLKAQHPPAAQNKAQLRETGKLLFQALYAFYVACEMVTPEEMNRYVLETAKVGEEVLNFALGNMEFPLADRYEIGIDGEDVLIKAPTRDEFFESQVRQFATQAVKLARASNTRSIQQPSFDAMRTYNDASFSVARATKVVAVMGHRAVLDPVDADAKTALVNVATGLAAQFNKLSGLALSVAQREPTWSLTPEMLQQFTKLYAAAVKDVTDALEEYASETHYDATIHACVERIVKVVDIVQKLTDAPDGAKLIKATSVLITCIETIASRAFLFYGKRSNAARREVLDQNPIVREQLTLSLMSALQHGMQFVLAALGKTSYYPVIPPEIVMVNSIRGLLASLSVGVNAMVYVLHHVNAKADNVDETTEEVLADQDLTPEETAQAIVDILHYVRPVKKVQQDIVQEDAKKQEDERDELLKMMETTVGLKPEEPAKRPTGPEPPRPSDVLPKPAAPKNEPTKQPEPAKPAAAKQPEPAKPAAATKQPEPDKHGAGAGQDLKNSGKKPDTKGKGKDDPKGKGKDDPKKPDPKKPDPKAQPTPAKVPAATPASTGSTSSTSTTSTPAAAPAAAAAPGAPTPNADGSIPCPVAGLPPLPAGWKIEDVNENNLPPGFPEAPIKPTPLAKGASEDEYKAFMKNKFVREEWDNKVILYKIRMTNVLKSMGKM